MDTRIEELKTGIIQLTPIGRIVIYENLFIESL